MKEEDDYESLAKSLVFELRAHAGERTKTAEELAEEQREILLELEVRGSTPGDSFILSLILFGP